MKNFEDFNRELESLDKGDASSELGQLTKSLRAGLSPAPSEQEQVWAWTRLQARLATQAPHPGSFFWMRMVGWGSLAVLSLLVGWTVWNRPESQFMVQVDPFHEAPGLCAVAFHSPEAHADVVWVEGYSDMQENEPIP